MSVRVASVVTVGVTPPGGSPSADGVSSYSYRGEGFYEFEVSRSFSTSAGDNAVTVAPIANVKSLYIKSDTPVDVKITHAGGTLQVVPLDKVLYIECPNRPITAITITGAARGTIAMAGD